LIHVFRRSDDSNPIAQSVFLQELFCQVLEVSFRERNTGRDSDFVACIARYFDIIAELPSLALDFDAVVEELFKVGAIKDTISGWTGVINDEFVSRRGDFCGGRLKLSRRKPTEKATQQSIA